MSTAEYIDETKIVKIDDYTVEFTLNKFYAYAEILWTQPILSKAEMSQVPNAEWTTHESTTTYVFTDRHKRELEKKAVDTRTTVEALSSIMISKQLLNYPLLPEDLNEMIEFAATTPLMTGKVLDASLGRIF